MRLAMATAILVFLDLALLRIVNLPLHVVILNSMASVSGLESDVVRSALSDVAAGGLGSRDQEYAGFLNLGIQF